MRILPKIPRHHPEGSIPLLALDGTAFDCGQQYGEILRERYHGGFASWLTASFDLPAFPPGARKLLESRAPHLFDLHAGLFKALGTLPPCAPSPEAAGGTAFAVAGKATLDGHPLSGQTKDTLLNRVEQYLVLRLRITGAPAILTLTYPGDMIGHGLWTNGMGLFRLSLFARGGSDGRLTLSQWALLALSSGDVHEAAALARRFGIAGCGSCLLCDVSGDSVTVEFNAGGVGIVHARQGISTHANHPVTPQTVPWEEQSNAREREDSRARMETLHALLRQDAGHLTPQQALHHLSDHRHYPLGLCRHGACDALNTTAAVVAEPTRGLLHVVRGNPCANWPVTYRVND